MEQKITTVSLAIKDDKYYADKALYQWNYGQILRIIDAELPMAVEVGFSTTEKSGDSDVRVGTTDNGVTTVAIPNKLFKEERSTDYSIYAFVYVTDENSGTTVHEIVIPVKARAKQGDPSEDPSVDPSIFKDAVNAVNASANRAEEAEKSARESAAKAKGYAESAGKSKEDVENARDNAITAIGTAKESALRGIESKTVESLQKIQSQTEESRNSIKQSIADATEKKTELDGSISNATDAKGNLDKAVQSAGNAKTELDTSIGKAGEAKTALDSSIRSAGEKQLALDATVERANTVDASLKEQIGSAEQIQANVEQIAKNKADISSLNEDLNNLSAMLNLNRTDKVYSVDIPKWETTHASDLTKTGDNAGLVCLPSTSTEHRQNDYEDLPWFKTFDVNAIVDDNGVRKIIAVKGDDNFSDTEKDVFVCGMSYYEKWEDLGDYYRYSRAFYPKTGFTLCPLCVNRDGSTQPFFLIAKYMMSYTADGVPMSVRGRYPFTTTSSDTKRVSMNDSINWKNNKGKFYTLSLPQEVNGYVITTWYLMFGNMNNSKTMKGCVSFSNQHTASVVSDEKHNYFPVTKAQADAFPVGSCVSIGYQYLSNGNVANDRYYQQVHQIARNVKILKKEAIDDNNSAIYVDCEPFATASQMNGETELKCLISAMMWESGFSENIKGRVGAPCTTVSELTSGKFPICFNGIELLVGCYETMAGFDYILDDIGTQELYGLTDATKATTNPKPGQSGYILLGTLSVPNKNTWQYITDITFSNGCIIPKRVGDSGSGETVYVGDAVYTSGNAGDTRELLALGGLGNWGSAGLSCLNLGSGLGSYWWAFGGRLSANAVGGVNSL
mgnify:FL=1